MKYEKYPEYRATTRATTQLMALYVTYDQNQKIYKNWTLKELTELVKIYRQVQHVDPMVRHFGTSSFSDIVHEFYTSAKNQNLNHGRDEFEIENKLLELANEAYLYLQQMIMYEKTGMNKPEDPPRYILAFLS